MKVRIHLTSSTYWKLDIWSKLITYASLVNRYRFLFLGENFKKKEKKKEKIKETNNKKQPNKTNLLWKIHKQKEKV